MRKKPKQARGLCMVSKIKLARFLAIGKTVEDVAILMGKCPGTIRRGVDWWYRKTGATCQRSLLFLLGATGLLFTCEREKRDWAATVEAHRNDWKEAA